MNRLYTSALVVHVVVAVLGLGSIASVTIVASGGGGAEGRARLGGSIDVANEDDGGLVLRRVTRLGYAMCALIAVIAVLMEVKPF